MDSYSSAAVTVAYMGIAVLVGMGWTLWPAIRAPRDTSLRVKFGTADLAVLVTVLSFPALAASRRVHHRWQEFVHWEGAVLALLTVVLWTLGVALLSQWQETRVRRRLLFLGVVLPASLLAAVAAAGSLMALGAGLTGQQEARDGPVLMAIAALSTLWGCRRLASWIAPPRAAPHAAQAEAV